MMIVRIFAPQKFPTKTMVPQVLQSYWSSLASLPLAHILVGVALKLLVVLKELSSPVVPCMRRNGQNTLPALEEIFF